VAKLATFMVNGMHEDLLQEANEGNEEKLKKFCHAPESGGRISE